MNGHAVQKHFLHDGDVIRLSAEDGELSVLGVDLDARDPAACMAEGSGAGRELFALFRANAPEAERGGSAILAAMGACI